MIQIKQINDKPEWLDKVIALGDSFRNTLGFLTKQAFADYAQKNRILIAVVGDDLAGYLLFRQKDTQLIIVHLCIHPAHRKTGIARALVERLHTDNEDYYSAIRLSCRRDYGLDRFWQALRFVPISERAGRATRDSTLLTHWIRTNPNVIDLFSLASKVVEPRSKAVLDTNVVIDICEGIEEEVLLLTQSFMYAHIEYCVSPNVIVEINKSNDSTRRNIQRDYVKNNFVILELSDSDMYSEVYQSLCSVKAVEKDSNTAYDISHIAYAVASGCQMFITRDTEWLNPVISEQVFDKYGLLILSPGQLVKTIDEINSPASYSPLNLVGLDLQYAEMQAGDLQTVSDTLYLYEHPKKKALFRNMLQKCMANPDKYHILLLKSKMRPVALVVYSIDNGMQHITSFLINEKAIKPSLMNTLTKRLAFKIIEDAKRMGISTISVDKAKISETVSNALQEGLFIENGNSLIRVICAKSITKGELDHLSCVKEINPLHDLIVQCSNADLSELTQKNAIIQIEKVLWPLKVKDADIPCFIIPIRASYAMALFDEDLNNTNMSLFTSDFVEPALSIEKVYYKKRNKSISCFPARILWYVSYDKKIFGSKMVRACSYLDGVEVGTAKDLYQKYRRLGVLEWKKIKDIANPDGLICVYKFSFTEQFSNPVPYEKLVEILGSNYTFQSFTPIDNKVFYQIYEVGCGGLQNA